MKKAIHYISDVSWFSERSTSPSYGSVWKALSAHRQYVSRGGEDESVIPVNAQPKRIWKERVENRKRWDERIAGKFVVAIPNDLSREEAVRYVEELFQKIASEWNLPKDHIEGYIHLHRSNVREEGENYHVHVIVYPKTKEGKALRLGKKELRRLHELNKEHLKEWGYTIVMREKWERLPKIGVALYKEETRKAYNEWLKETAQLSEELRPLKQLPPEKVLPLVGGQVLKQKEGKAIAQLPDGKLIGCVQTKSGEWIWIWIDYKGWGTWIDIFPEPVEAVQKLGKVLEPTIPTIELNIDLPEPEDGIDLSL